MKEFECSEAEANKAETAILVGLITPQQDEAKTKEYLDELDFLADTAHLFVKFHSRCSFRYFYVLSIYYERCLANRTSCLVLNSILRYKFYRVFNFLRELTRVVASKTVHRTVFEELLFKRKR